jgi:hypothetical protein
MPPVPRYLSGIALVLLFAGTAFYGLHAVESRNLPDMGPEHRIRFDSEFTADRESQTDWQAYLRIENELAAELETKIVEQRASGNLLDRYAKDSLTFPDRFDGNWNRSYELAAAAPVGVAVLLHGLTDSPYSMLATAEALAAAPCHYTAPHWSASAR